MKKIVALMLVVAFVFTLSACNNKNAVSNIDTSAPTSSETFVKPENYTSVLLVSINPQFKLYLDETNKVLAVEPVNDDAKSFSKSIDFENKSVEAVVGNIIEKANIKGFISENAAVNFEITEQKDGVDYSNILTTVVSAVNQKATELKIEIKTEIKENDKAQTPETNNGNTQTDENSKPTTSSKNEESTSNPTTTSKPTESKPTHTHSYSAATCTTPQKCSCGATNGSALSHNWQDATCKAPKTCSVCKTTEGEKVAHIYEGVRCKVCNNPLEKISTLSWGIIEKFDDSDYRYTILDFKNNILSNCGGSTSKNEYSSYEFKFNNINYFVDWCEAACLGNMDIKKCIEYEDEQNITIYPYMYEYSDTDYIKLKRLNQTDLIVVENTAPEWHNFEVGKILKLVNITID